jgi:tRNA (mo5U34)-methyltransferase
MQASQHERVPRTRNEILRLVPSKPWFHRFRLVDDIITPGRYFVDALCSVEQQFAGLDLSGKKVLEIATWDGPYSFALEARGAIVDATDIQDPDRTGFNVAKKRPRLERPVHPYQRVRCREVLSAVVVRP